MGLSNYLPTSAIAKPGVCTSSTRPASPYDGQVIYETDTDKTLVWNGSAWVYLSTSTANPVGLELISSGSFSGTTSYNNVFTSAYDNYRLVISNVSFTGSATLGMRLRAGGADQGASGSDYFTAYLGFYVTAATNNATINGGSYWFFPTASTATITNFGVPSTMDLFGPQKTQRTYGHVFGIGYDGNFYTRLGMAEYNATTACDGFTLYSTSANTISGTVQIYGYKQT